MPARHASAARCATPCADAKQSGTFRDAAAPASKAAAASSKDVDSIFGGKALKAERGSLRRAAMRRDAGDDGGAKATGGRKGGGPRPHGALAPPSAIPPTQTAVEAPPHAGTQKRRLLPKTGGPLGPTYIY